MGKQVSKDLHRKGKQLFTRLPGEFSDDFEKNKKKLHELGIKIPKTELNVLAGILVTLANRKET